MNSDHAAQLARHGAFLERLAQHLVADVNVADDLVQEAYTAALSGRGGEPRNLRSWLAGAVRNRARALARGEGRRRRREAHAAAAPAAVSVGPLDSAVRLETQEFVLRCVRDLAEPYRTVIVLRFYDDRSPTEIAGMLGVPASTVRTRSKRALAMLRKRLDESSGGDRETWRMALFAAFLHDSDAPRPGVFTTALRGAGTLMALKKGLVIVGVALLLALLATTGSRRMRAGRPGAGPTASTPDPVDSRTPRRSRNARPQDGRPVGGAESDATATVAAQPSRETDLFGEVLDEHGRPVAGAHVSTHSRPWQRIDVLLLNAEESPGPVAETGADGRFVLPLIRGEEVRLRVSAAGFTSVELSGRQAGERVRVVLSPGGTIRVTVRGPDGVPARGARVEVWRGRSGDPVDFSSEATTDASGSCELIGIPPGPARLAAEHPLLGSSPQEEVSVRNGEEHHVELSFGAARVITGRVFDALRNSPVAGARVGVGWRRNHSVSTDKDGRFVMPGCSLDPGLEVVVTARGFSRAQAEVLSDGELEIGLVVGDSLTGRALGADGLAVREAPVVVQASHELISAVTGYRRQLIDVLTGRTDASGRFRLDGLRHDLPYALLIHASGHGVLRMDVRPRQGGAGEIALGDIRLPPSRTVTGRVEDASGAPVPRIAVKLVAETATVLDGWYGDEETRTTDDLGRFAFRDIAPGSYELATAAHGGVSAQATVEVGQDADPEPTRLRIEGSGRLQFLIVDNSGRPLSGVWVWAPHGDAESARTDESGRAVLSGLSVETLTVRVKPPWRMPDGRHFLDQFAEDLRVDGAELRLTLAEAVRINGRVEGPDGEPLPRVLVRAYETGVDDEAASTATDESGRFTLFGLAPHTHQVVVDGARAEGLGTVGGRLPITGSAQVDAPAADVVIRTEYVAADRTLAVRVLSSDGDPVRGASVHLLQIGEAGTATEPLKAVSGPEGAAQFTGLSDRALRVSIDRPGTSSGSIANSARPLPVRVVPSGQTITVSFRRGSPITGTVRDSGGRPVHGARVELYAENGFRIDRTEAALDGSFRLVGVPGGAYRVVASFVAPHGGTRRRATADDVLSGSDLALTLE